MTKNTPTARERREQALLDLNGQSLQMAVLHQPMPNNRDIGTDRIDDLFYNDTEVRTVRCSTRTEAKISWNVLKDAGYGVWLDVKDLEALTLHYFIPFNEQGSMGSEIPERIWNAEYQEVAF